MTREERRRLAAERRKRERERNKGYGLQGATEAALSIPGSLLGFAASGGQGLMDLANGRSLDETVKRMNTVSSTIGEKLSPNLSQEGMNAVQAMGEFGEVLDTPFKAFGDTLLDVTDSPEAATAGYVGSQMSPFSLMLKSPIRAMRNSSMTNIPSRFGQSGAIKNVDARRAAEFMKANEIQPTGKSGNPIDLNNPAKEDMALLRKYGQGLENSGFKNRELLAAQGGHKTVLDESGKIDLSQQQVVDPEIFSDAIILPMRSDPTSRGVRKESIGGIKSKDYAETEGGYGFAADPVNIEVGRAYESTPGTSKTIVNRMNKAVEAEDGKRDAYWITSGMKWDDAMDFTNFPMEDVLAQMDVLAPLLRKEDLAAFTKSVQDLSQGTVNPKTGKVSKPKFKNAWRFKGFDDPETRAFLLSNKPGAGDLRKAVMDRLKKKEAWGMGLPDYSAIHAANNDPLLRNIGLGEGLMVMKAKPGVGLMEGIHGAYGKGQMGGIPGEFVGVLPRSIPGDIIHSQQLQGRPYGSRHRAIGMDSSYEIGTDELIRLMQRYLQGE